MVKKAAESLTLAFIDYPMIKYLFPNEKTRFRKNYWYFRGIINYGRMFGNAYATSENADAILYLSLPKWLNFRLKKQCVVESHCYLH